MAVDNWQTYYSASVAWYTTSVPYAIGNVSFFSGATAYPAIQSGPSQWNAVGTPLQFWYAGADNSNYSYPCAKYNLWFYQEDLSVYGPLGPGTLGKADYCTDVVGVTTRILGSSVRFNDHLQNAAWYILLAGGPAESWRYDLASVSTHEVGHVTGWYGHFSSGGSDCPWSNLSLVQTMCQGWPGGTTLQRTLGTHDISNFDGKY